MGSYPDTDIDPKLVSAANCSLSTQLMKGQFGCITFNWLFFCSLQMTMNFSGFLLGSLK